MDRLECDRMFVAVMETGSFTGAAARLGKSSGQASKLVSRLETELGVRLLNRTTRAVTPTEAGRAYFDRVRALLTELDDLSLSIKDISQVPRGRVRLTAPLTFGAIELTGALNAFAKRYPEVALDVSLSDRVVNLVDEGFDLAVRIGHPVDSSLIARSLCQVRVVPVASAEYLDRHGTPQTPEDLARHACIIDTNFREPGRWVFRDAAGEPMTVAVAGRLHFSNAEACLKAAIDGLGPAYMPSFVAGPAIKAGQVRPLLTGFEGAPLTVFALYPHSRYLAAKVRVLVDFLVERYRGKPAWEEGW